MSAPGGTGGRGRGAAPARGGGSSAPRTTRSYFLSEEEFARGGGSSAPRTTRSYFLSEEEFAAAQGSAATANARGAAPARGGSSGGRRAPRSSGIDLAKYFGPDDSGESDANANAREAVARKAAARAAAAREAAAALEREATHVAQAVARERAVERERAERRSGKVVNVSTASEARGSTTSVARAASARAPSPPLPPAAPVAARPVDVKALGSEVEEKLRVTSSSSSSSPVLSSSSSSSSPPLSPPSGPEKELALSLVRSEFPARAGFGSLGTRVQVFANHFPVRFTPQGDVYHYDVAFGERGALFANDGPTKTLANKLMAALLAALKRELPEHVVVSDGRRNLYAPRQLPFDERAFAGLRIDAEDAGKEYSAVVKAAEPVAVRMAQLEELFAGRAAHTPQEALQALDIALRHTASTRFTSVGRKLFSAAGSKPLGQGAELWFGSFQSLRATQSRLVLNLDVAATAFVQAMSVEAFACETLGIGALPPSLARPQHAVLSKALSGVKVTITHRPGVRREYRVNRLSSHSAEQTFFETEQGARVSVAAHFLATYQLRLRHGGLPCLHVGAIKGNNYLPLEVCTIVAGQKCPRRTTDRQTANMIRFTCQPPAERRRAIEAQFREAAFDSDPVLQAFGLHPSPRMTELTARVLPAPQMLYKQRGQQTAVRPTDGVWSARGAEFVQPAKLSSWAVINCCDQRRTSDDEVARFFRAVVGQMSGLGMDPPARAPPIVRKARFQSVRAAFEDALRAGAAAFGARPQVVWMVTPFADAGTYGELKRASDSEHGVVSQCMLAKHIAKCQPQYIANVLLKVNTKLGGRNTIVAEREPLLGPGAIVFGADVTHPSPLDRSRPSVAAVVASLDAHLVRYAAAVRAQGHRVEQIEHLRDMVVELLKWYYRATRAKPERIVFYRDGVSEGQFAMVRNFEIAAIREACALLEKGYAPPVTFIVVQKRHNTRVFPADPREADRSGNVKAGTVVDRAICHPTESDFYLVSHAGLQGTSRPTHYHVLLDEAGFSPDALQHATYKLCYTFARCTRAVSLVPPAYYAHLLAFRARFLLADESDTASSSSGASGFSDAVDTRMLEIHPALRHIMFYV